MEMKVKWSRLALSDVKNIFNYIKNDSLVQASRIRFEIFDFADGFSARPRGATVVPETKDVSIRQRLFYGWRIIYQIEGGEKPNRYHGSIARETLIRSYGRKILTYASDQFTLMS